MEKRIGCTVLLNVEIGTFSQIETRLMPFVSQVSTELTKMSSNSKT